MFWLVAGVMIALALGFTLVPLLWRGNRENAPERNAYDIAVYRDQLKELDTELTLDEISKTEAATARLEIERRILRAAGQAETMATVSGQRRPWILAAVLAVLVTAFGLGLYLRLGTPDLADHPFSLAAKEQIIGDKGETLATLTEKLVAYLEDHPDNLEGWARLRQALGALGESPRAAQLLQQAVTTQPGNGDLRVMYGESLVAMSEGQVSPAAKLAFEQALKIAPNHPGAQYYLALGAFQNNDAETAYNGWAALAANSPPDAPWMPQVNARLREAAEKLGRPLPQAQNGPTAEQQAAIEAMPQAERDAMIRAMVEKFAARMKQTPDDYEGWFRLGRAYEVLGEKAKAVAALKQAQKAAPREAKAAIAQEITRLEGKPSAAKPLE